MVHFFPMDFDFVQVKILKFSLIYVSNILFAQHLAILKNMHTRQKDHSHSN
jgi:hypothetical protein